MSSLRILTAGESHGKELIGIIEGLPAGLKIDQKKINYELLRRQIGYGRGDRMKIESDQVEILSGLRFGQTLGSPISMSIQNKDWNNWKSRMAIWKGEDKSKVTIPRPGHADLAGSIKYRHQDLRNVLERASARETAVRVAVGAIIRQLLEIFDIIIGSHVIQIYTIKSKKTFLDISDPLNPKSISQYRNLFSMADSSDLRCCDSDAEKSMKTVIDQVKVNGDSVGGIFELAALNVPIGLGSYVHWDRRLDAQIAADLMSIPAIKAVEIGLGRETAEHYGSEIHDPILPDSSTFTTYSSNRAGGIEGGMSNGAPVIVRATMKPIPTLVKPLDSVDLETGKGVKAHKERSDVCAVPAASVIAEAMLAITLGRALCDKLGGDSITEMKHHFKILNPQQNRNQWGIYD